MEKFKVGDKVRILEEHDATNAKIGGIAEIIEDFDGEDYKVLYETNRFRKSVGYIPPKKIELVAPKPTKNQRITALEDTVAKQSEEISELKLIVHELRDGRKTMRDVMNEVLSEPSTTNTVEDIIEFEGAKYRKVEREAREGDVVIFKKTSINCVTVGKPYKSMGDTFYDDEGDDIHIYNGIADGTPETVDVYELIKEGLNPQISMVDETIKPLTPNQQRTEIIEKAKVFVDENGGDDYHFEVDENERTVFAYKVIISGVGRYSVKYGLSKCHPNDVFNTDIGKAISFGRAEKLDVSEFEQAVQPTMPVVGSVIQVHYSDGTLLEIYKVHNAKKEKDKLLCYDNDGTYTDFNVNNGDKILSDTNAQYEVI